VHTSFEIGAWKPPFLESFLFHAMFLAVLLKNISSVNSHKNIYTPELLIERVYGKP